ncbi:MAG TPA: glycosyltransferase family 2 protein [Geobacteraceae bacterium]|nr:glycosyltransferase family 2 protein [Geobacteraceae bacterium]
MKISATVIVKNEEKNIFDCLNSLDFADEIIVVDSGSSDRTGEICSSHPKVRFYERAWEGFGRQKNIAAGLAANDWILNVDADERVTPELLLAIRAADFNGYAGFRVARRNFFGGRWIRYCGWYPDYNIRLYSRRLGSFKERAVHEAVECSGEVGKLQGDLLHYSYSSVSDYLQRMDRYSSLAAEEIVKSGRNPGYCHLLLRPAFTFFKMYLLKLGIFEGYLGFQLSILYSMYTFAKYAKAVELSEKVKERV